MPAPVGLSPRWPIRPHECDVRVTRRAVGRYPIRLRAMQVQEATAARLPTSGAYRATASANQHQDPLLWPPAPATVQSLRVSPRLLRTTQT